jgi:hypothetical protein
MSLLRRHYILPAEHGAWIWWIGPLLIGLAAAGSWSSDVLLLVVAILAGFLLRQPATLLVKIRAGRRSPRDVGPALTWLVVDLVVLALVVAILAAGGHTRILVLAIPGLLVFAWHLSLVSRRDERGQMGIEIVGAGVLALAAPAAYWVCGGPGTSLPWILWLLCWLQSAASIVLVYFRLGTRKLQQMPSIGDRAREGARSLLYHGFNVVLASGLAVAGVIPGLMAGAFLLMLVDAIAAVARPPFGQPPTRIGVRQLLASSLFVALSVLGFLSPP